MEELAAGHRADFERERDRADRVVAELLRLTADAMMAREEAAVFEGRGGFAQPALVGPPYWLICGRIGTGTRRQSSNL